MIHCRYGAAIIDPTWHKGLIHKLYHSGIKGGLLILLSNFLTDRISRNNVNGYTSEWFPITISLPQGLILSPILFLVCIGDLSADPKTSCPFYDNSFSLTSETTNKNDVTPLNESKFADDYHLWRTSSNITELETFLQSDLKIINCWCHKWRINLNLKKMKVLLFNGKHKRKFKEGPCLLSYNHYSQHQQAL